ncbi:uncharacterized protein LOC126821198 [Patella vulgata]|uniref:uncharacterized protein LOC126821198 n=1 Tax=Patella vulgata TaxID=6465 RepID=UPI0024A9911F|nr:uncharacterized protein LOC126821198 [Patella vulgata]
MTSLDPMNVMGLAQPSYELMCPLPFIILGGVPDNVLSGLQQSVLRLKRQGLANTTKGTYRTHLKTFLTFCVTYNVNPVPISPDNVELYIAYLVDFKCFAYSSYYDPISQTWSIKHMLTGVKRELGTAQSCKSPVTPKILLSIRSSLDLSVHNNQCFWAACLLGFFGFLRPNNFLVKGLFDPDTHIRRMDVIVHSMGYPHIS